MGKVTATQLRLRRAFRYGYIVFAAITAAALALFGLWAFGGEAPATLARSLSDNMALIIAALGLALCVPLFFAAWLVVGASILGNRVQTRSLMDGIKD